MALKQCKECHQEVSTKAKRCPHCGVPVKNGVNGWLVILGVFLILPLIGKIGAPPDSSSIQYNTQNTTRSIPSCSIGTPTTAKYFVIKREIPFYLNPDKNKGRVVNAKASEIFKRTEYRTLWPAMVLQGRCEIGEWLQAKIIEADGHSVDWETGWVEKNQINTTPSQEYSLGLIWDIDGMNDFSYSEFWSNRLL